MRDRHAIAENNDHPEQETAEGWPAPPFYGKMRTSPNGQAWVIGWPYSRKPSRNCSVGRIRKRYEGGDKTFVTEVPNASFCFDGDLTRMGFVHPDDVAGPKRKFLKRVSWGE